MLDIIRDSTFGTILNAISGGRILPFADQRPDYVIPQRYLPTPDSDSGEATRRGSPVAGEKEKIIEDAGSTPAGGSQEAVVVSDVEKRGDQPEEPKAPDPFLVDWEENDPENPR